MPYREFPYMQFAKKLDHRLAGAPGRVVNLAGNQPAAPSLSELAIDLGGFAAGGQAEILTLAGETLADENTYAEPERLAPRASSAEVRDGALTLSLAPYSLTRVRIAGGSA